MKTVTWRANRLAYVLLAKDTSVDLQRMADGIASGQTGQLYGKLPQEDPRSS
jgi:hypothetical protein